MPAETLPHYRARSLRAMAIGRGALIDLPGFTMSGKRMANVRHAVTHAERAELRVQLYGADELEAARRADLYAVVRAHLPSPRSVLERLPMGRGRRPLSIRAQVA
jgi:phosphatidylglycerol lysyltransferase